MLENGLIFVDADRDLCIVIDNKLVVLSLIGSSSTLKIRDHDAKEIMWWVTQSDGQGENKVGNLIQVFRSLAKELKLRGA